MHLPLSLFVVASYTVVHLLSAVGPVFLILLIYKYWY